MSMSTDSGSTTPQSKPNAVTIPEMVDEEDCLRSMLEAAESALELTDLNMNSLQNCIDSMDELKDSLDGDIMILADDIKQTIQQFPLQNVTPSFHQKILSEQLRMNRMMEKYPDLEQTERDIMRLHSNFISRHKEDDGMESLDIGDEQSLRRETVIAEELKETEVEDGNENGIEIEDGERGKEAEGSLDSDNESNLWCHCRMPSKGNMIRCDHDRCKIKWFHWKCCRITKVPQDKWFCKHCRRYSCKSNILHPDFITPHRGPL